MLSGGAASRLGRETCEWWSAVCWRSIYKKLDGSNIPMIQKRRDVPQVVLPLPVVHVGWPRRPGFRNSFGPLVRYIIPVSQDLVRRRNLRSGPRNGRVVLSVAADLRAAHAPGGTSC
jgi:hypothetical protein